MNDAEREDISLFLSIITNPHDDFMTELKQHILKNTRVNDNLLVFSSIIPRTSTTIQSSMVSFLLSRFPIDEKQVDSLTYHILALGNTGLASVVDTLLGYLHHKSPDVQHTTILSLRLLLNEPAVEKALKELLIQPKTTVGHVNMIANALLLGAEDARFRNKPIPYPETLVNCLVEVAAKSDDQEVRGTVMKYLKLVNTKSSLKHLALFQTVKFHYYNKTPNDDDLLSLLLEKEKLDSETNNHMFEFALKKQFGSDNINIKLATDGFASVSDNGEYSILGRGEIVANIFNSQMTFLQVIASRSKTAESTKSRIYVNVMGNILMNLEVSEEANVCKIFSKSLYDGVVFSPFNGTVFEIMLPIRIGTLFRFEAEGIIRFRAELELKLCDNFGNVTASFKLKANPSLVLDINLLLQALVSTVKL